MRRRIALGLLAMLGVTAFAPAPLPRSRQRDDSAAISLQHFQGLWRVTGFANSRASGEHGKRDWHIKYIRVQDDQWSFMTTEAQSNVNYAIDIDPSRNPATLDFFSAQRKTGERPQGAGIIRRNGREVTIIYSFGTSERARSFEQPPDGQYVLSLELMQK